MSDPDLAERCRAIVGPRHVLTEELASSHALDWTGRWAGDPSMVVRPATPDEVARVVAECSSSGTAIVAQGGNTGLVGATAAPTGSVLLSLRRLDAIEHVDDVRGRVRVQAGVTLAALHERLATTSWRYAVDFAAREGATIGGTIATNAGGVHVFRFGSTRAQVLGLDWVGADGEVIARTVGLDKDNTGYDLGSLLVGSEGTLGIVTGAELRLVPRPSALVTALIAFDSVADAVAAAWSLRRDDPGLEVAELIDASCLELVSSRSESPCPVGLCGAALLVESAGWSDDDVVTRLASCVERPATSGAVAVATSDADRGRLWAWRDEITTGLAAQGPVLKFDLSVPHEALAKFATQVGSLVTRVAGAATTWVFGHVCDANLHVNVTGGAGLEGAIEEAVLAQVLDLGGSISAEHGIGRAKVGWLERARSAPDVAAMRAIKRALDPSGVLNPGAILGPIDREPPVRP